MQTTYKFAPTVGTLLIAISSLIAVSCASNSSQQGQAPATNNNAPSELKKDPDKTDKTVSGKTSIEGYACDDGASLRDSGLNFTQGKKDIDGNTLSLFTGRSKNKKTLCELLKETGKKAAIFQFGGFLCISCQDEAKELQEFVNSSKGKDVAHVFVFTDLFEDVKDEDFEDFIKKYAPKATIMYDESKLWKYYSKDPAQPSRATIMTMNLNSEAHIINEEGQFKKIFDAATDLVANLK